ncbi:type I DNA topoisomerase [bacterium]|nr:type I DNA topoisomerase [bacterium]
MNLVIVESPGKTKTIENFLGEDYKVVASKGHIRDIKNTGIDNLGLDFNNNYKPVYAIIPHQESTVRMLNKEVEKASNIFLATDPDREGEAISWHLNEVLNFGGKTVKRIEFNEITKDAVQEAIKNPRDIDTNIFASQETRKIMDRIIGFKLSSLLKKAIGSSKETISAGRVQSVALKMIINREEEINSFNKETYYEIEAQFRHFKAKLVDSNNPKKTLQFTELGKAESILADLDENYIVKEIIYGTRKETAPAPFTTSTLLQSALNKYSMSSSRTLKIAQELYEGVEINGRHVALITYMRSDSTRLSDQFMGSLVNHLKRKYGEDSIGYAHKANNNKSAQDAHEAIRPVSLKNTLEMVEPYLSKEQFKIYKLIYTQTEASMMKDAIYETKTALFSNNGHIFSVTFERPELPGFKLAKDGVAEPKYYFNHLEGDVMKPTKEAYYLEKTTEGPKRFTEATLIKEMESSGIGRPSTYATTINTLKMRKYVEIEKKQVVPTKLGTMASKFLDERFSDIININYTASMEKELDEIAVGSLKEENVVDDFYKTFKKNFEVADKPPFAIYTGEICPKCGSKMSFRSNSYGVFEACSNYPTCKYIKKQEVEQETDTETELLECPECHTGHLVVKEARVGKKRGNKFYGCSNYPTCKFTIDLKDYVRKK